MKRYRMVIPWVILGIYLILFFNGYFQGLDRMMYNFLASFHHPLMNKIVISITSLGAWYSMVIIALVVWLVNKRKGTILSFNMIIVVLMNMVIKSIVMRPRPLVEHLVYESSFSFPSGHSMVSFAVFGLIAYYLYICDKKYASWIMIIPLFIGLSRIYLGVHYATDVLGGFLFAYAWLCTMIPLMHKYHILQ